jgi:hypothetical protein
MPNTRDLRKKAQQARRAASIQTDDRMIDRELRNLAERLEHEADVLDEKQKAETS